MLSKFFVNKMKRKKLKILDPSTYDLGIFSLDKYGILSLTENGKILFLFLSEILGIFFLALTIRNWSAFFSSTQGKIVLSFSILTVSVLFISIFFKNYMNIKYSEYMKQMSILIFISLIFITLYYFDSQEKIFENTYYLNPLKILYTYILIYMITFYFIHNIEKI